MEKKFKNYLETIGGTRALICGLVIGLVVGGVVAYNVRPNTTVASQEEVLEKTRNYMLQNMVSPGTSIEINKITEENGLYKLEISLVFEGKIQNFISYATKDGEILFPTALNMSGRPILPSTTTPPKTTQPQMSPPSLHQTHTPPPLPGSKWSKTFGGTGSDSAKSVQETSDGGYIMAGYTESFGAGGPDVYLIKTDGQGGEVWSKTFGGTGNDSANSVQETSDGGYVMAGYTDSFGAGSSDVYLIKTDGQGGEVWSKTFGGTDFDKALSIQETSDGGYIMAGYTKSFGSDLWGDVYLIKTDGQGDEMWSKTFGGTYDDLAASVQQTLDGGYILAGHTYPFGMDDRDVYIIKTDAEGNEVWSKTFGDTERDRAYSVQQTSDGGYVLAGSTQAFPIVEIFDVYLIKTDSQGGEIWSKTFGDIEGDSANSVQQTSDGGYVLAGTTNSFDTSLDVFLIKTDGQGDEVWNRTFGGTDRDRANSVQQTSDGGYIMAGFTKSFGAGDKDVYLIKVDA